MSHIPMKNLKLIYQKAACKTARVVYFSSVFISNSNPTEAFKITDSLINPIT